MQYPDFLINRKEDSSKIDYGHALLVAGAYGKMGCTILSAKACMRMGAGLITVHVPQKGVDVLQVAFPEAMVSIDQHSEHFSSLPQNLAKYNAIGIGPGVGTHEDSFLAMQRLLSAIDKELPMVIDADGLNILSRHKSELVTLLPHHVILTPHEREFDRLFGENLPDNATRLEKLPLLASELNVTIILKGHRTAICSPEGSIVFSTNGNAGMATAGSGDVLTGILLGLISQNTMVSSDLRKSMQEIALLGTQIHGKSGDLAAKNKAKYAIIASDIVENIGCQDFDFQ